MIHRHPCPLALSTTRCTLRALRRMQVSPHDCTGCELCVHACPDHALTPVPIDQLLAPESTNWDFFKQLPYR